EKIKKKGAEIIEIKEFNKIGENVFSTGEFEYSTKEHSLVLETKNGLVVITGCAHPGILNILKRVEENFSKNIFLVLGGFHLDQKSQINLEKIIKEFKKKKIKKVGPSHCSGDRARRLFEKRYKNNYIKNGAGKIVKL
ncbi:MAG: MBL fold metallo-hydrolase, partial [Minisyncoccales bacterium]